MTYSKTQLDIIKAFGSKELSEGCLMEIFHTDLVHREMWWDDYETSVSNCIIWKYISWFSESIFDFYYDENIFNIKTFWECWETNSYEILWHIPELFPDVARELQKQWYVLELLKIDTIKSVLKISWYDMKKDILIPYKKLIPFIDQDEQLTLIPLLNLFK